MNEVGRNELCPCGSGRKYKFCHLKPYSPTEHFAAAIKAFEISKRVDYRLPPSIQVIDVPTIVTEDPSSWNNEVNEILAPLNRLSLNKEDKWQKYAIGRIQKLHHKLNAIKFHQTVFLQEEERIKNSFDNFCIGTVQYDHINDNPILIFMTEAFLFQTVSFLDVFAQLIGRNFKFKTTTYENYGQGLIDKVKRNPLKGYPEQCNSLIDLLTRNMSWIRHLTDMRVEVTHYSDLEGLACFLQKRCDNKTDKYVKVFYPSLTDGERVSSYMNGTLTRIKSLISDYSKLVSAIYPAR